MLVCVDTLAWFFANAKSSSERERSSIEAFQTQQRFSVAASERAAPVQRIADLFEAAALATNNSCVGLHTAQNYHYESAPILILAMLAAPSVDEGIRCLLRYDKYAETAIETRFISDSDPVHFVAGLISDSVHNVDHLNEYLLSFFVQILKTASRKEVPVTGVWFRHSNNQNKLALEDHFGASVDFGMSDNRLFFRQEYLQEPFITSNNLLFNS